MDKKKDEIDLSSIPSAGVVLAPGCKDNLVSDSKFDGFPTAVWVGGSTDGEPQRNVVTGIEASRFQSDVPVSEQAAASNGGETQSPAKKNDPWYKQVGIKVLGAILSALAVGVLAWLGLIPTGK